MEKLLQRQLAKFRGEVPTADEWKAFLAQVNDAYAQADRDRALLERSLDLTSFELLEGNAALRADVANRHRMLNELRNSEERARALVENISDIITITGPTGEYKFASPSVKRILGYDTAEIVGRSVLDFVHPSDVGAILEGIANVDCTGQPAKTEFRYRHKDGSWRTLESLRIDARNKPGIEGYLCVARDVTETRRMEAEAQGSHELTWRQERLSALGTLVAGVAHEINNPLTYIIGNLEFAQLVLGDPPSPEQAAELRHHIQTALDGSQRISRITKALKTVARQEPTLGRTRVDLCALARDVVEITRLVTPDRIEVNVVALDSDVNVMGDPAQIHQVVLNLAKNAAEALGEGSGTVSIVVRRSDGHGELQVIDNGPGIDPVVQARLFTPFYTTKAEGTGLGLSIVHSIMKAHHGDVRFESALGRGSTFVIRLPVAA